MVVTPAAVDKSVKTVDHLHDFFHWFEPGIQYDHITDQPAIFGLQVELALSDRQIVALATGTAVYLAALPPPPQGILGNPVLASYMVGWGRNEAPQVCEVRIYGYGCGYGYGYGEMDKKKSWWKFFRK